MSMSELDITIYVSQIDSLTYFGPLRELYFIDLLMIKRSLYK